jgi:hypothetical protein
LAAAVRRAVTLMPSAVLHQATGLLDEAHTGLTQVAQGTNAPELPEALAQNASAREMLAAVSQLISRAQQLLEVYVAGLGVAPETPTPTPKTTPTPAAPPPSARPPSRMANGSIGSKLSNSKPDCRHRW